VQRTAFSPLRGPPEETLLWTAQSHAENSRLEKELASLRAVAQRQRGEVRWLNGVKAEAESRRRLNGVIDDVRELSAPDSEAFKRRVMLLQQREHSAELEKEGLVERERALRDQELNLALERERQTVRKLVRERMDEQRERLLDRDSQKQISQADVEVEQNQEDIEVEIGRKEFFASESHASARRVESGHQRLRPPTPASAQTASTGLSVRSRGWASIGDTEPEAEVEAGASTSGSCIEAAAAEWENAQLRKELQGLRQLAQWQQGEVHAALASTTEVSGGAQAEDGAEVQRIEQ